MSQYGDDFGDKQKNIFLGFGWKGRKRDALEATTASARDAVKDKIKGVASAGASVASQASATLSAASASTARLATAALAPASSSAVTARTATSPLESYDDHGAWYGWLYRLFGPRGEAWIGALALLFTTAVFGITIKEAINSKYKDKTGVQRIFAKRWNERTLAFPIEGTDAAGRRALFDVVVLTKNYGWVLGSTEELARGEQKLGPEDIETEILAPQLRSGLNTARELIAVGVASQEGAVETETHRAGLRAKRTAEWVRGAVDPKIPMWTLNLGRYLEPCADCEDADTSWQRPFVVIAVKQADQGTDIGQALHSALSDKQNLPAPERYSSFALAKFGK
jgi:hypothetical protein